MVVEIYNWIIQRYEAASTELIHDNPFVGFGDTWYDLSIDSPLVDSVVSFFFYHLSFYG